MSFKRPSLLHQPHPTSPATTGKRKKQARDLRPVPQTSWPISKASASINCTWKGCKRPSSPFSTVVVPRRFLAHPALPSSPDPPPPYGTYASPYGHIDYKEGSKCAEHRTVHTARRVLSFLKQARLPLSMSQELIISALEEGRCAGAT